MTALRHQRSHDGDLVLRAPTDNTLSVLDIVGMKWLFTIT